MKSSVPYLRLVPRDELHLVPSVARPELDRSARYRLVSLLLIAYPFVLLVVGAALCVWSGWLAVLP